MKAIILFALVAAAMCLDTPENSLTEEATPKTSFVESTLEMSESETAPLFIHAKAKLSSFLEENSHLQADAAKNACAAAANASIQAVYKEVQAQQSMLNRLRTGKKCRTKNSAQIRSAGRLITTRRSERQKSNNALSRTMNSRVKWSFSYRSMFGSRSKRCSKFYHSSSFKKLKTAVKGRKRDLTRANARLAAARSNMRFQNLQAQVSRAKCYCSTKREAMRQFRVANRASAARSKTLLSEMMVKCLASSKNAARCKNLRLTAAQKRKLRLRVTRMVPQTRGSCRRARRRVRCSMRTRYRWQNRSRLGWTTKYRHRRVCRRALVTKCGGREEELIQSESKAKAGYVWKWTRHYRTSRGWKYRMRCLYRGNLHRPGRRMRCQWKKIQSHCRKVWGTKCTRRRQAYRARTRRNYRVRTTHKSRWCRLVNRL